MYDSHFDKLCLNRSILRLKHLYENEKYYEVWKGYCNKVKKIIMNEDFLGPLIQRDDVYGSEPHNFTKGLANVEIL